MQMLLTAKIDQNSTAKLSMKPTSGITQVVLVSALLFVSSQAVLIGAEKSKYFGAKLIELDALIEKSRDKHFTIQVSNSREVVGFINIQKGKNKLTAVEFANAFWAERKATGQFESLTKPTSGLFSDNNSTFKGIGTVNSTKVRYYYRVMKSGFDCYLIIATMPDPFWKDEGDSLVALVDSFKFN